MQVSRYLEMYPLLIKLILELNQLVLFLQFKIKCLFNRFIDLLQRFPNFSYDGPLTNRKNAYGPLNENKITVIKCIDTLVLIYIFFFYFLNTNSQTSQIYSRTPIGFLGL